MNSIIIKNVPPKIHRWLKQEAERQHRSLNRQALATLEQSMTSSATARIGYLPPPVTLKCGPLSFEDIDRAKREGRP
jgi:hypothetical protein